MYPPHPMVTVLYDDEHGTDLLIDGKHNVNLDWLTESLSAITHVARDGSVMEVQFNETFGTYLVMVGASNTSAQHYAAGER